MPTFLRPIAARLAGVVVALLATWLASKFGVIIPEDTKGQITESTVVLIMAVFTTIYALVHKAVSVKTNPADAASPSMAQEGKAEQKAMDQTKTDNKVAAEKAKDEQPHETP